MLKIKDFVYIAAFMALLIYTVFSINDMKSSVVKDREVRRLCREYFMSGYQVGVMTARQNPDTKTDALKKGAGKAIDAYLAKATPSNSKPTPVPTKKKASK